MKAFLKAWEALCSSTDQSPTLVVPNGKTFSLLPLIFEGPCKASNVHLQIDGDLLIPKKEEWSGTDCVGEWVRFSRVNGLIIDGSGTIDGQGATWWGGDKPMERFSRLNWGLDFNDDCGRPTAIRFYRCDDLRLSGLKVINGPRNHFAVGGCDGAVISGLHIEAPDDSPNTDGIDFSSTTNTRVENTFIGTGDDCIAVNGGVKNLTIDNLLCGPGHGISIGSLGKDGSYETVEDVTVQNCKFTKVQNGARIKTWEGGAGYVKQITYKNITLDNAGQPIIIDQNYCPEHNCGPTKPSSVAISDVSFTDFSGTTATIRAILLNCSSIGSGCTNVILDNVQITKGDIGKLYDENDGEVYAYCRNVHGKATSTIPSVPCLE
uniref:Polygalacturonase n=1 Tax=Kalanchoe fedtschenkoi TaxID=63787 RepID=A0A7N0VG09_KALFE